MELSLLFATTLGTRLEQAYDPVPCTLSVENTAPGNAHGLKEAASLVRGLGGHENSS